MSKKMPKLPSIVPYESMIFNQFFHFKFNGALLRIVNTNKNLQKYSIKTSSETGLLLFLYFINYNQNRLHMHLVDTKVFKYTQDTGKIHDSMYHQGLSNSDGQTLPIDFFKEEEKCFEIVGYWKDYKMWPTVALAKYLRIFSDSNGLSQVYQRISKIEKETKDMEKEERHQYIRNIVQEIKFYKAL